MKHHFFTFSILLFTLVISASGQFERAMGENIPAIFFAENPANLQSAINQLSRIGAAEQDRWEPHYYVAFGYVRMSDMHEKGADKDKYLDMALDAVKSGEAVSSDNSELEAMRGYVHMMRVVVDPATRGMQYSGMAFGSFQKAVKMDPKNPRAHYLLGRMKYGTAKFMGNGDGGACESFAIAKKLYDEEKEMAPSLHPRWGNEMNDQALNKICKAK